MDLAAPASFLKIVIVLLFGGAPDAPVAPQSIEPVPVFVEAAPVHAKLDLVEARKLLANSPQLQQAIYGPENANRGGVRRQAVAQLAQELRISADALLVAFDQIHRVHFSLIGFGEDDDSLRFAAILQCGQATALLQNTFGPAAGKGRRLSLTHYGDVPMYQIGQEDEGIWIAQRGGRIMAATDPVLVQRFLSSGYEEAPIQPQLALPVPVLLEVDIDPHRVLTELVAVMEHDLDDFLFMSSVFDFGSWKKIKAVYDGKRVIADLSFGKDGRYAGKLGGTTAPPSILGMVPETAFFSVSVNLNHPEPLGKAVIAAIRHGFTWAGDEDELQGFLHEFRDEVGVDLETDVLRNMSEAALVFARPDDEPTAILYKAGDAEKARQMIQKLMTVHAPEGTTMRMQGAWETWEMDGALVALTESTIAIGEEDNAQLLALLQRPVGGTGTALPGFREHLPNSTATIAFAPWKTLMPEGMPGLQPIRVGLNAGVDRLHLEADIDIIARARTLMMATQKNHHRDNRLRCMSNLRQLALACILYSQDHDGQLPPNLEALKHYIGTPEMLICPESGKPYVYNNALANIQMSAIENPHAAVLIHDTPGAHENGGNVAFIDGHTEWQDTRQFQKTIQEK